MLALSIFCSIFIGSKGQAEVPLSEVKQTDLPSLVEILENKAERDQFLNSLKGLIEAKKAQNLSIKDVDNEEAPLSALGDKITELGAQFSALTRVFGEPQKITTWFVMQLEGPEFRRFWSVLLAELVVVMGLSLLAAWAIRRALANRRGLLERREPSSLRIKIPLLCARTIISLLPLAGFALVGFIAIAALEPSVKSRDILLAIMQAIVLARSFTVALSTLLTPLAPSLRLFEISDQTAVYAFVWIRRLISVPIYGYFLLQIALSMGLAADSYGAILKLVGLSELILLVVLVMQMRETVAARIYSESSAASATPLALNGLLRRLAEIWHILIILYIVGAYIIWVLEVPGGFTFITRATGVTIIIVIGARFARAIVTGLVWRTFSVTDELQARYPQIEKRANRYLPLLTNLLTAAVYVMASILILQAWQIDIVEWLLSQTGREILTRILSIGLILLISMVIWELVSLFIAIYLERADANDSAITASARVRTLLPLARNALLIVIVAVVTLTVLAELGVNIGPLLAGAGVAGLAIGFGAQTLVKDVITGAFILFEDQISVGDVVCVAGYTGVVEGLTVRTIRLRDLYGRVHVVPFSAVSDVTNFTKEYSYAVIDAGVAYRENTDEVSNVLAEIGRELRLDSNFKDDLLEPLEIMGVEELADSAVVIRVRFKTTAGRQWAIGREFNRRMKLKFDKYGIEIPFPHQTLYLNENKNNSVTETDSELNPARQNKRVQSRSLFHPSSTPGENGE